MIHKNIVIGSGFSSLGAILGLQKKREKFLIITGKTIHSEMSENLISLPSRDFNKFKKNIYQSLKNNNLSINIKNNFISYLGFGGLSNLWGKVFNLDIKGSSDNKNYLIKKLKIKNHHEIKLHKKMKFYKLNEQNINLKKLYKKNFNKQLITVSSTVKRIEYDIEKKIFILHLVNNKFLKTKNVYLACGIFSTLKLLRSINKKIFKKKINLNHSDMCYGIFFSKKNIEKNMGNEFVYYSRSKNKFAGRISILNEKIIEKYNLNFFYTILYKFTNIFKIKMFVLSILYKRNSNDSILNFSGSKLKINAKQTSRNQLILSEIKKIFHKCFGAKCFVFRRTLVGSDFHYSSNVTKNINIDYVNKFDKNLFILDSTYSTKHIYFPTFQMIYDSFYRVKKNISLNKIINTK